MIELMVVVVISAILLALAAPSMSRLIANQRVRSTATDLHMALLKTRAEAIKRNADGINRSVVLRATDGDWNAGWSIAAAPPVTRLEFHGPLPSVTIDSTPTQVEYLGTGRIRPAGPVSFVISGSGTDHTRCLSIDPSGRSYLKEGSAC